MMIDRCLCGLLLFALAACARTPAENQVAASGNLRVRMTAEYDPALLGQNIDLKISNEEAFPVCFSSNDLELIEGGIHVRNLSGDIISGHGSGALEDFKGINVVSPIQVVRPRNVHSDFIDIGEFSPQRQPLLLQIRLSAFRCSDLFDEAVQDVPQTMVEKVFRISSGRIAEQPGLRFPDTELPQQR